MNNESYSEILRFMGQLRLQWFILLILGLSLLAYTVKMLHRGARTLSQRFPKHRLLFLQVETTAVFFVYIFGGAVMIYSVLRPAKELMFALGGGVIVAVGLSLKDLVASLFAGLILLFDRPFQVGDRVQFGDTYGEIKSIGLRAVRLNTLDDNLVTIPNVRFITDVVSSGNSGALDMMVVIPFHVALDADISRARDIIYETAVTCSYTYLKKPVKIVASEEGSPTGFYIKLSVKAYVLDVQYEKAMQTDIVLRTTEAFLREKIKRPILNCMQANWKMDSIPANGPG